MRLFSQGQSINLLLLRGLHKIGKSQESIDFPGFLAPLARLERTTSRLGGGPSIQVRYRGIFGFGGSTCSSLGGGRSILLSYGDILILGAMEVQ